MCVCVYGTITSFLRRVGRVFRDSYTKALKKLNSNQILVLRKSKFYVSSDFGGLCFTVLNLS